MLTRKRPDCRRRGAVLRSKAMKTLPIYAPYDALIAPARASAGVWRILVGAGAIWFGAVVMLQIAYGGYAATLPPERAEDVFDQLFAGETPAGVFWTLASFAAYTVILAGVLRALHNRSILSLIGPISLATRQAVRVIIYLIPLYVLITVMPAGPDQALRPNLPFGTWLIVLLWLLPLIALQSGTEELVFRGYFQSQLAATFRNPLIWLLVPSSVFAAIHWGNADTTAASVAYVVITFLTAVAAADVTGRAGTLGPALAMHFINNTFAIGVFAYDDWLYGASLWVTPLNGEVWTPQWSLELIFVIVTWLAARLAIRA